jgi:serine/threonine-protein kinase
MYAALADQGSENAIRTRLLFGEMLQTLGRNDEAKPQLQSALTKAEATTPHTATLVAHAEADLARVDASLGEQDAANRLRSDAKASLASVEAGPNTERDTTQRLLAGTRARDR